MIDIRKPESMFSYRVLEHRSYFDFILCTASYRYLLQLAMHVSSMCVIKAESILVIGCPTEPANLAPFQKCLALQGMNCLTVDLSSLLKTSANN